MRFALSGALLALALALAACGGTGTQPSPTPKTAPTQPPPSPTPEPTPEPVTKLLFTGDLIPARCTYAEIEALGGDYSVAFQPLHDILSSADITVGTLDGTASDAGTPIGCVETLSLAGPAAAVAGFQYAGFDVISQAGNHAKDCGVSPCGDQAMLQTEANLEAAGILSVGTGNDIIEARQPVVIERNGMHFAFLAYDDIAPYYNATATTSGTAPLDPATVAEDVNAASKVADVVIVLPSWGVEYTSVPTERQREFARNAIEAGATLVVGNHPHWVQAHESIGDRFVAYALGNFLFDQDWSLETQQGAMLEVDMTGARITGTRYIPIHIYDQYQPRLAAPDEAQQILDRIETASASLQ